ncbi:hypothetical protein M9H77_21656 [Catharanthus roseus]|uniref:Uncharacterized protein n=1 Tax=Catharanthus roseus TaxID=4058 RepID=A0ACC0ASB1_CATRO|nr:hypothetical protein M9H77_21656 [Catharanthus roseus]
MKAKSTYIKWIDSFEKPGCQFEHEVFIVSWLSRFFFLVDEITKIDKYIIPIAMHLAKGINIALYPLGLITSSTDMDSEDQGEGVVYLRYTLWAPFYFIHQPKAINCSILRTSFTLSKLNKRG